MNNSSNTGTEHITVVHAPQPTGTENNINMLTVRCSQYGGESTYGSCNEDVVNDVNCETVVGGESINTMTQPGVSQPVHCKSYVTKSCVAQLTKHLPQLLQHNGNDEQIAKAIMCDGRLNCLGLKIQIKSTWNVQLFESLCTTTNDRQVATFLRYGWPLNRDNSPVSRTWTNHPTATRYANHVTQYLCKELKAGTLLGPYVTSPFLEHQTGISPMSTRPKKLSEKRRILVDLSWPRDGHSVNSGIPKDTFMEQQVKIVYPTIDMLCKRAIALGPKIVGWRKDLERAFRILPLDPKFYSILGVFWSGAILFDKFAVMGCRSAPYACQETTSAIRHFMHNMQHIIFNYVDDFMSIDYRHKAWASYNALERLLRDLGVKEADGKSVAPTHIIEFLGILFDLLRMLLFITEDKLKEIKALLYKWHKDRVCTKKSLQSITGKLQFASLCVRPGRVFVTRLYDTIALMKDDVYYRIPEQVKKDLQWWRRFMEQYNGCSMMWLTEENDIDEFFASDACLKGLGGKCGKRYFYCRIPESMSMEKGFHIAHYEMMAILVGLKLWKSQIFGKKFSISCDNQSVVDILTAGRSRDEKLQQMLREITYLLAINQAELVPKFLPGRLNKIPDLLSRWYISEKSKKEFLDIKEDDWIQEEISDTLFNLSCAW